LGVDPGAAIPQTLGKEMKILSIATRYVGLAAILMITGCNTKKMTQGTGSMDPTIRIGETIIVDLHAYDLSDPARWDVVLIQSPLDSKSQWCKRIVGLPGEKIEIRGGDLMIDGVKISIPSRLSIPAYQEVKTGIPTAAPGPVSFPFRLKKDAYFVLGDNVSNSLDSRYWGALDRSKIIGKVIGK
jgi:signal peptidase I